MQKPSVSHTHRSLADHQYRSVSDPSQQRYRISDRFLHNMEAPRGSASYFSLMINQFGLSRMHITGIMAKPLRLRGGANIHPNDDPKNNDVLSLTAEALAKLDLQ